MSPLKFCSDCYWSKSSDRNWENRCHNPYVVSKDAWALSNNSPKDDDNRCGVSCRDERDKNSWFAPCGRRGKQWKMK